MKAAAALTADQVRKALAYDPESGVFHWLTSGPGRKIGNQAGSFHQSGYIKIAVNGHRAVGAHRLAWIYMTGSWPEFTVDHIDTNRSNNRWSNLRSANNSEQKMNQSVRSDNSCGLKGAYKAYGGKYRSQIKVGNRFIHLGVFETAEQAHAAYGLAASAHFGQFARPA